MRDEPGHLARQILDWYDVEARELPWRVPPADSRAGVLPDPYRVWLSEVMLQQTTVAAVKDYFFKFTGKWPTVGDLAAADDGEVMAAWAGLGYYARARNLLKCARVVAAEYGGCFPQDRDALLALPGIGPYTAGAIGSIAFGRSETVVDGNIERVMARLFGEQDPLPAVKPVLVARASSLTPALRAGDYAQAVMDLGATVCTPRSPSCALCPWNARCAARAAGIAAELPRRARKPAKPVRLGIAYIAQRSDGAWLLERRADKGLLGGMLGWPGSDWSQNPSDTPPFDASWTLLTEEVRHTFTHFHLRLKICVANISHSDDVQIGEFIDAAAFDPSSLPTVMRKAYDLASRGGFEN